MCVFATKAICGRLLITPFSPMPSIIRFFSARSDLVSSQVSPWQGFGRNDRSLVLSRAVNRAVKHSASSSVTPSTGAVIVIRSSRWRRGSCPHLKRESAAVGEPGALAMAWACPRCTYLNQGSGAVCGMCALDSPQPVVDSGPEWSCPSCTFFNHFVESSCEMCNTARPKLSELERTHSTDQGTQSTGKFRPLRVPSQRNNADKERSHETADERSADPAVSNDLRSLIKESDMISRKRKAAAVEDEEGLYTNEMDVFREKTVSGDGEVSREVSNRLLGELHAQRMARINKSLASSDLEKNIQTIHGQPSSALAVDSSSAQRKSEATAGLCPNVDFDDDIVILTYNVWFAEEVQLQARMNSIGKIIQLRQPHVICLQEVTPNIYSILQESSWWSLYKCSVTPTLALKRAYFCIQLSRLPVSAFYRNPFKNSIMGRELVMADLDYAPGEQLVVATTHLESPCPAPPTWNQMFSKERVFQANEALKLMKELPNVVFGGDMNWDDKLDGAPPLPPGWFDAWLKCQPNQPGLTYDCKANPMLGGGRLLKRLDRVFCHLRDFTLESIEMVGTQPIAGLTYKKERKVKGQVQLINLPVLPSDHFGLLLKLKKISA